MEKTTIDSRGWISIWGKQWVWNWTENKSKWRKITMKSFSQINRRFSSAVFNCLSWMESWTEQNIIWDFQASIACQNPGVITGSSIYPRMFAQRGMRFMRQTQCFRQRISICLREERSKSFRLMRTSFFSSRVMYMNKRKSSPGQSPISNLFETLCSA